MYMNIKWTFTISEALNGPLGSGHRLIKSDEVLQLMTSWISTADDKDNQRKHCRRDDY